MGKLSVTPKHRGRRMPIFDDGVDLDDARRLRNALVALASLDSGWMWWVERNIPPWESLAWKRRMVERQARLLCARQYRFLGWGVQLKMIYADYYFRDDGSLKTYL